MSFEALTKRLPFATHVDFEGQHLAEKIFQLIIIAFGLAGFAVGYLAQQFSYTVYTLGIGFALASLVVLPPWPFYRRNPLKWQKPLGEQQNSASAKSSGGSASSKSKETKKKK